MTSAENMFTYARYMRRVWKYFENIVADADASVALISEFKHFPSECIYTYTDNNGFLSVGMRLEGLYNMYS